VLRYLTGRLLQLLPVLVVTSIAVWGLAYILPGGPAVALLGQNALPSQIVAENKLLGLNKPVPLQYILWLDRVLRGNFGLSDISGLPVLTLIRPAAEASFQLALCSFFFAVLIGIPLGVIGATSRRKTVTGAVSCYNSLNLSIPSFWLGILLILFFSIALGWFPSSSQFVPLWQSPLTSLRNLLLPALALGLYLSGIIARFVWEAMRSAMNSDYVYLARAKGLRESKVVWYHALRNAMLPTLTVVGLYFGAFVGGVVLTEAVFDYPGMGYLVYNSVLQRDYPTLQAAVLFIVAAFVAVNLAIDVLYVLFDPRIRYAT
jgi:peptide/nickel transport system permease protein